jgi:Family of unknown function (DUF5989)
MFRNLFSPIQTKFLIIAEFFTFLWARRLWWMIPMFTVLLLLGVLMLLTHSSAIAPFIYPLF